MTKPLIHIRKATERHLRQIKEIADANKESIGFVLRPALIEAAQRGELLVAVTRNGRVLGFVNYHHRRDNQVTIYEICVKALHRGKGLGRCLIEAVAEEAREKGKQRIRLKCPVSLDANRFYRCVGYRRIAIESGKKRKLNVWEKIIM